MTGNRASISLTTKLVQLLRYVQLIGEPARCVPKPISQREKHSHTMHRDMQRGRRYDTTISYGKQCVKTLQMNLIRSTTHIQDAM